MLRLTFGDYITHTIPVNFQALDLQPSLNSTIDKIMRNTRDNWGEPERAPPSLYNEEISVCLSVIVRSTVQKFAWVGRENFGGLWPYACALNDLHVVLI